MSQLILLIRHAQAQVRPGRLMGWTPGVHLSEQGRVQAESLAARLGPVRLAAVYSSPLERCQETAQAIVAGRKGMTIRTEPDVGEVIYGSWQGRKLESLAKTPLWRTVQLQPSQATFPKGESIRDLQRRGVDAIERIRSRHRQGVVAVVSHQDTLKAITAHYLGMHLDMYQRISIANASVTAFAFAGVPRLLCLSDTGSYTELASPERERRRRST